MVLPLLSIVMGLVLLVWSADRFVSGASATAKWLGMPPLLIGMVIVGFGTSAPEMVVSAIASAQGNPGIAMGNAYGSNIANIGLILGLTAVLSPIAFNPKALRRELPFVTLVTMLSIALVLDHRMGSIDSVALLFVFSLYILWSIRSGARIQADPNSEADVNDPKDSSAGLKSSLGKLVIGLIILIGSSRLLVWGAVEVAHALGVSDLIIGLTIVAVGTSLPEMASSLAAARRGESDLVVGNIIGSNLFNTLVVIGIAGSIAPFPVSLQIIQRDMLTMLGMTISLFLFGYGFIHPGRISRLEGGILMAAYTGYTIWLMSHP
ncbi:MAG: calcium/sodium antiporter [Verrucomicrobia bacterium]|nr:calcium/sodium antiporter [Verrucomicrobiota bacterium]